jgi:hypothetical protein
MVVETGVFPGSEFRPFALAQRKELVYEFQIGFQMGDTGIGTVVEGAVLDDPASSEYPGILVVGDSDYRIRLTVLEVDVVPGMVLLDEVVLQKERLVLVVGDQVVYTCDLTYQVASLDVSITGKIGADSAPEALCLADIDDSSAGIPHYVDPRAFGEVTHLLPDGFCFG